MGRGSWLFGAGALLAVGGSVVAANAAAGKWADSPTPLTTLLMQHDAPVDFMVSGEPKACIGTSNASYLVINDRQVLFERQGKVFLNDLAKRCPGLRREREDGVPGISAVNTTICAGQAIRLNYDRGSGPALCLLGEFVPVQVAATGSADAAPQTE